MNVNLHHLQLYYYVVKAKGISSALKEIPFPIQQPAVSQQMKQLEDFFGVSLFERRPFSLTPAGERLYDKVAPFFESLPGIVDSVKNEHMTRVVFGCPSIISGNYLPDVLEHVLLDNKKLQPIISEHEGKSIYPAILGRTVDVGVVLHPVPKNRLICSETLISLPMAIIVPKGHRFIEKGFWPKADFPKEKWVCLQDSTGGNSELEEAFASIGIKADYSVSTNSVEAAFRYIMKGFGLGVMVLPTQDLLDKYELAALPAKELFGEVDLSVIWHEDCKIPNKILQSFITSSKKHIVDQEWASVVDIK